MKIPICGETLVPIEDVVEGFEILCKDIVPEVKTIIKWKGGFEMQISAKHHTRSLLKQFTVKKHKIIANRIYE